ncbi:MAG: hypothetical protein BGO01_06830 [Armatimonadetes bacterium 55-13]|nr:MAG: hypothetical protein BGO01_06830 [Armatimonadetes bacterium 55-13]
MPRTLNEAFLIFIFSMQVHHKKQWTCGNYYLWLDWCLLIIIVIFSSGLILTGGSNALFCKV